MFCILEQVIEQDVQPQQQFPQKELGQDAQGFLVKTCAAFRCRVVTENNGSHIEEIIRFDNI